MKVYELQDKTMKRAFFLIAINIIPLFWTIVICEELLAIFYGVENYPFGSDFFSPFSIYQSKKLYVSFIVVHAIFLITLIVCSIFRKWKFYYFLLAVCIIMFLYPMLTNG